MSPCRGGGGAIWVARFPNWCESAVSNPPERYCVWVVTTGGVGVCDDVHLFSFFFGDFFFRGALCGGGGVASSSSACFFFCLAALMGRPSIVVAASLKIVKGASSGLSSGDGWESFPRRVS